MYVSKVEKEQRDKIISRSKETVKDPIFLDITLHYRNYSTFISSLNKLIGMNSYEIVFVDYHKNNSELRDMKLIIPSSILNHILMLKLKYHKTNEINKIV